MGVRRARQRVRRRSSGAGAAAAPTRIRERSLRRKAVLRTPALTLLGILLVVLTGALGPTPALAGAFAQHAHHAASGTDDNTPGAPTTTAATGGTASTSDSVQVTLESISPMIPVPGKPLELKAIAVNTGTLMVTGPVRAYACVDPRAITTPSGLAAVQGSSNTSCRTITTDSGGNQLWQELGDQLSPGQRIGIDVKVPWTSLGIKHNGVYVVGIKVLGTVGGERVTAGTSRTTIPVIGKGTPTKKVRLMLGIPLTYRPTQLASGTFVTNALTGQLTGNGRLGELLTAGKDTSGTNAKVTWLVDPSMLAEIREMSDGYQVRTQNGQLKGPNQGVAANWLQRFRSELTPGYPAVLLPYGDPDVAGLAANDQSGLVADGAVLTAAAQRQAGKLYGHTMVSGSWSENADAASTDTLSNRQPQLNLISTDSWSASSLTDVRTDPFVSVGGSRSLPAVAVNPSLVAGGPDTGRTPTALSLQQRLLSETALIALSGSGPAATMVAIEPRTLDPSGIVTRGLVSALSAPWITPIGALQLQGDRNGPTVPAPAGDAAKASLLPAPNSVDDDVAGQLATLNTRISLIGQILSRPTATTSVFQQAMLRSASLGFSPAEYAAQSRSSPVVESTQATTASTAATTAAQQTHALFLRDNLQLAYGQFAQVRILPMRLVTLSGQGARFPLTIANDLGQTVSVRVRITGQNGEDLHVPDPGKITIGPKRKATLTIIANVGGNGLIHARAVLVSPNVLPNAPASSADEIGQAVPFVVQAASYGPVAWILIIGGAGLLLAISGLRIARRIRRERRTRAGGGAEGATGAEGAGAEEADDDGTADAGPQSASGAESNGSRPAHRAPGRADPPKAGDAALSGSRVAAEPGDRVETEPDA